MKILTITDIRELIQITGLENFFKPVISALFEDVSSGTHIHQLGTELPLIPEHNDPKNLFDLLGF